MLIKIILLANIFLTPTMVHDYLLSKGIRSRIRVAYLATPLILGHQNEYFDQLSLAFTGRGLKIVVTDPFMAGVDEYILGLTKASEGLSLVAWNDINNDGEPRTQYSLLALAHELGHECGLNHSGSDRCHDILDADAMGCPNALELTYTAKQRKEINECLK